MAAFSLVDIDAEKVGPIIVLAGAGIAMYFAFEYLQTRQAKANAGAVAAGPSQGTAGYGGTSGYGGLADLEQLALLQNVLGGNTSDEGSPGDGEQATYTSPNGGSATSTSSVGNSSGSESGAGQSSTAVSSPYAFGYPTPAPQNSAGNTA